MIIVNIDGPDAVGKTTTVASLVKQMNEVCGIRTKFVHFPRYETEIGQLIKKVLLKEIDLNREALQMLYCVDRLDFCQFEIPKILDDYDVVLVDRYLTSGIVYGQLDYISPGRISMLQGTTVYPDVNIILQAPYKILLDRMKDRGNDDIFETSDNLKRSIKLYNELNEHMHPSSPVLYVNANRPVMDIVNEIIFLIRIVIGGNVNASNFYRLYASRDCNSSD